MKMKNLKLLSLFAAVVLMFASCNEDEPCVTNDCQDECNQNSYVGTFVGKYKLLNLLELNNNDTVVVSVDGDSLRFESKILNTTFSASYQASDNSGNVDNISFPSFTVSGETLNDISVKSGRVRLLNDCERLYVNLNNIRVESGTIDLGILGGYPLTNASLNTPNGLVRQ